MTTLWSTTGSEVVRALIAERRIAGAVASGVVLTLVVIADESAVEAAEQAATVAASQHPCRLVLVVRRNVLDPQSRLDAEVLIGGRLGPGEAVVLRMNGRLGLHAESVVLPLLAPDAPVVTWWYGDPPDLIAHDPLGVLADRRVTDVHNTADPITALRARAQDYAPGDTDLAWARTTSWRSTLAAAFDTVQGQATAIEVEGGGSSASTALLAAWLGCRLGVEVAVRSRDEPGIAEVRLQIDGGQRAGGIDIRLGRDGDRAGLLTRTGQADRRMPLPRAERGELMAEELRRLDHDPIYAAALARIGGLADLSERSPYRTHVWRDPDERAAAQ
ncbi:MAG TPA: glucose-6-phosphate dehydrogenase assembly protein OpcA [Mycobacteriales bacterium]|jgi:glucose-6-phosphate dehydrogenase assembly protein OpcA|nr:glucose-6-phosphate dehydrogenase assembly protein OpcA [Mycobacteriales bacterium]